MDSLTQAVLGAGICGAILGRSQGRKALLYGAVLGTLPDLDVLQSYPDPVSTMTFHRGWSHSVLTLSAFAVAVTALARRFFPNPSYTAWRLLLAVWLALVTHPILDSFTSYGTQLFWPIASIPESWSSIFIIDPVYTVPMLLAVILALIVGIGPRLQTALRATVLFGCAYLAFSLGAKAVAEHRVEQALSARGQPFTAVFSSPMPLNTLLWRVVAKTPDDRYFEAVTGLFDSRAPEMVEQPLNLNLVQPLAGSVLYERLKWFTGDWLRYDISGDDLVVTDLRMGMVGYYTFRFKMGERDASGVWRVVTPESRRGDRGADQLGRVLTRIVQQEPPLPLKAWSERPN